MSEFKMYVGCKIISAKPEDKDGINGYTVVYPNTNGGTYTSWSPVDVFETCYRTLMDCEKRLINGEIC